MNKKIRNPFTGSPYEGKKFVKPSETVPDQTMDVRTILKRYARGLPITGNAKAPEYHGIDGDGIDLRKLDLVERQQLADRAKQSIEDQYKGREKQLLKQQAEKLKAEAKAEFEAEQASKGQH